MTEKRIQKIADFLYSSDSSFDVPFRIALIYGMAGDDLTKEGFISLLRLFSEIKKLNPDFLRSEFKKFRENL